MCTYVLICKHLFGHLYVCMQYSLEASLRTCMGQVKHTHAVIKWHASSTSALLHVFAQHVPFADCHNSLSLIIGTIEFNDVYATEQPSNRALNA